MYKHSFPQTRRFRVTFDYCLPSPPQMLTHPKDYNPGYIKPSLHVLGDPLTDFNWWSPHYEYTAVSFNSNNKQSITWEAIPIPFWDKADQAVKGIIQSIANKINTEVEYEWVDRGQLCFPVIQPEPNNLI
jgi:hypothetical protein